LLKQRHKIMVGLKMSWMVKDFIFLLFSKLLTWSWRFFFRQKKRISFNSTKSFFVSKNIYTNMEKIIGNRIYDCFDWRRRRVPLLHVTKGIYFYIGNTRFFYFFSDNSTPHLKPLSWALYSFWPEVLYGPFSCTWWVNLIPKK